MGWSAFTVASSSLGDLVASQLLELANDPLCWTLASLGATVIRRKAGELNKFYFSPQAAPIFAPLIERYRGVPSNPPFAREMARSKTSRMLLGFKTEWEPFAPVVKAARGGR
jgi:hypothetical protein